MARDEEIWERLCRGEREAFELLYREYGARVRAFLRQYVGGAPAAEDLCQETFLQIWRRPNGFDPTRGPLRRYLFGICAQMRRAVASGRDPSAGATPGGGGVRWCVAEKSLRH